MTSDEQTKQAYENGKQLMQEIALDILTEHVDCFDCPCADECREGVSCRQRWKWYLEAAAKEAEG